MKTLLPLLKKYRILCIVAPLFKMLEAAFDLIVPIIVASIIDEGIGNADKDFIISRCLLLVLMAALGLTCSIIAQFFAAKAAVESSADLRHKLFSHIGSLSFSQTDKIGTSTLITRMTGDINLVQNGVNMFLRLFLRSPFIVAGATVMAFFINKKIALVFATAVIVLFVIVFGIMRITNRMHKSVQYKMDDVTGAVRENISGVRVIRAFGREKSEVENFENLNGVLTKLQLKAGKISALMNPLTYVAVNLGIIAVVYIGAQKVDGGTLLSGDVIALINYMNQILVELVKLATLVVLLSKAIAGMNRIEQVLDTECDMKFGTATEGAAESDEAVRFDGVSLRYSGSADESLTDISFEVKKGETVGIIGSTGSGKSSLINLIPRFYDASSGCVSVFGRRAGEWDKNALRGRVAVVLQKAELFAGTVRSNLQWGKADATDEEMWKALEISQAADFVKNLPNQLDEPVEQGGRNFSGGQKQRLTIARGVIGNPEILILDDSSSALDYATDASLRTALKELPKETTVFIISQRTFAVKNADKILVLDDGCLVGNGKHDELLENCEVYREIYESQFKEEAQQ